MQIPDQHPHSLQIKEKMAYRETRQFNIFQEQSDPHSNEALGLGFPRLRFSEATVTVNFKSLALRPSVSYKRLLQGCMSQQEVWQQDLALPHRVETRSEGQGYLVNREVRKSNYPHTTSFSFVISSLGECQKNGYRDSKPCKNCLLMSYQM